MKYPSGSTEMMNGNGYNDGFLPFPEGFATSAIHTAQEPEQWSSMAVVTPLVLSTTYKQFGPAEYKQYEYSRSGNPTRNVLEKCLADLENGKYGLCFASGLGAITTTLGLLRNGDHLICGDDVYGGTYRLLSKVASRFGIEMSVVDIRDPSNIENAIKPNTKLLWVETPTNPTMKVVDLRETSKIAKKHKIISIVDNTFLSPFLQRPLDFGADIVVHSITKYINGHSDVVMGCIMTNREDLYGELKFLQNAMGTVPAPFDCYQVIRSIKTLALRMKQHMKNSLAIAKYLEKHPKVEKVIHPGLPSHPQHELFKSQTCGNSGMLSLYLKGGLEESKKFLKSLQVFTLGESLGGYESLAELPSVMTHAAVPVELREELGITDNFIRLSVGLEDAEDLVEDLKQALEKI